MIRKISIFTGNYNLYLIMAVFLFYLHSCGPRIEVKEEKITPPKPLTALVEEKPEIRYRYKGEVYKDPLVPVVARKLIHGSFSEEEDGDIPVLGTLSLKGIIKDKISALAVLSGPYGSWFLKNEKLYDKKGRRVKGITGEIGIGFITLTTEDNFRKTYNLHER